VELSKYLGILKEYWGYTQFRGIQWEIIESICSGKDTLGLMPTGGGKSVTFQVPALAMDGVCIVITPLIALMKDQVDHLRKKNVRAYAIYGTMQRNEILTILDNAVLGGVTLLYISPERLTSELFLTKLKHMHVSFITVDEAHCISQWGYDFRPSYLAIAKIRKMKPGIPVLAYRHGNASYHKRHSGEARFQKRKRVQNEFRKKEPCLHRKTDKRQACRNDENT
jgi:ATP-dependent DNA helicase RecQ